MRNTGIVVEFDRKKAMDSFNGSIRVMEKASAAIKAFASAVAQVGRGVKRDLDAFDRFEEHRKTEGGKG